MELFNFNIDNEPFEVRIVSIENNVAIVEVNGVEHHVDVSDMSDLPVMRQPLQPLNRKNENEISDSKVDQSKIIKRAEPKSSAAKNSIISPMPGVVKKVTVNVGDEIKAGDTVIVLEAMKMNNNIKSTYSGKITEILVSENEVIKEGAMLIMLAD